MRPTPAALMLPLFLLLQDIRTVPTDLRTPPMTDEKPAPGKRVRQVAPGYEGTEVYHSLYLPTDWRKGQRYPVLVEYAGNGPYRNKFGDTCTGKVEDCNLGYGISGGKGFIWICLPYISSDHKRNQLKWWGDVEATVRYCTTVVPQACRDYGGDPSAVFLSGFSRGSIACNFIGLHDDTIAALWRGFICHSHYDGVRKWGYQGSDRSSAQERLKRLKGRPQFISHEASVDETRQYLKQACPDGAFTFLALPYRNHTDSWVLRDIPARKAVRAWLRNILEKGDGKRERRIMTDTQSKAIPKLPKPEYLTPRIDPVFGSKIIRISGDAGTPIRRIGGTWSSEVRHHYSKDQAWNADMSLLILSRHRKGPNPLFLDGETYEPLFSVRLPGEARWHPTRPDIMQYVSGDKVGRFNVRTRKDETNATIEGYSDFRLMSEGNFSRDGNWVAPAAKDPSGRTVAFAYDIKNGKKYPDIDLAYMSSIDWVSISALGRYVVVNGSHNGNNPRKGLDQTRVFDLQGHQVGPLWEGYGEPSHYDLTVDASGCEVAVGNAKPGDHAGRMIMRRLRDGKITPVCRERPSHTSARNLARPGWAYGTFGGDKGIFRNEIVAVRLDGSMNVERICHMHLVRAGYATEGHASVAPDGARVIWNSNWGDAGGDVSVYVADVRHLSGRGK